MTRPLVIAHVLSSFGLGGQERVAAELARLQTNAGGHTVLAVSLALPPEGPSAEAFRDAGVVATTIAKGRGFDPSLPLRIAAHFRRERVDVVHTHNPQALIYGAPAARLCGAVAIHTKHGMNPDRARRLWLRRLSARWLHAYVAVSPALATVALKNRECDSSSLHVVSNGVDVARFVPDRLARRAVRAELGIPQEAWVVGTVGRLAPEKNQAMIVDSMASLLGERRHLVIVGDGPERDALRARIDAIGLGRYVHMTGARSDVQRLFAAFDAFTLSSLTEGLPLVMLEAMATGLPVVSTAVGGIPDLVEHGLTGLLVDVGDRPGLTRHFARLSMDELLSRRMGEAGRQHVLRSYSVDRTAKEYGALYVAALEGRSRALRRRVALARA